MGMTSKRRLSLFVSMLTALLACAPGGVCRADTATGSSPSVLWTLPSRPPAAIEPEMLPVPADLPVRPATFAGSLEPSPGEVCRVAILRAAARYGIPPDLMLAISLVESGRTDPASGIRMPWPWTANVEGQDYRFDTAVQAAAWLRQQQAHHVASIDTGCMQVNLKHHPDAFATAEEAFDPEHNADYAARFLRSLHDGPAERVWLRAAGFYHSQTPERAEWYRGLVEAAMKGPLPAQSVPPSVFGQIAGGGQSLSNRADRARIRPAPSGQIGRSLDAYRSGPIPITNRSPRLSIIASLPR
jgi:hypothetical protein